MKRNYEVELSKSGINELIKGLKDYKKWIKTKTEELSQRLAEIGVERATYYFGSAVYDGINDVKVEKSKTSEGWVVTARGNAVLFIEFGTGIYYPDEAPLSEYQGAEGMVHGSYGKGLGNNEYWFYTGQPGNAGGELAYGHANSTITHGNPTNMSMYWTVKELELRLEQIIKEVFESD